MERLTSLVIEWLYTANDARNGRSSLKYLIPRTDRQWMPIQIEQSGRR